ncbi:MAG: non-homologous end-joining DNA ligase [Syntrophorhabdaceae bacterium]|nr:non-homologous end-joining DNA ligase [Syntrophorhabdaceae bacterium]MDD4194826.1 non-homologous end-joining DNA ligase [Syntrophorhabdaceae bacterium]
MKKTTASVGERCLPLSNLDKDLYPSFGFTKAHVLEYYRRISPCILPHLKDRALTLKRYPDGVEGDFFFEKRCPRYRPSWIETADVVHSDGSSRTACLVNDLDALIWVGNLASLELHVPMARASTPETPDFMVFDLDPGESVDILGCAHVAFMLRSVLAGLNLRSYPKTSGKKGLHVYVPLNNDEVTFDDTKKFSRTIAEVMQRNYPDNITAVMAKDRRKGKVFINWAQNGASNTTVCAYSLRAALKPTVSTPLTWDEVDDLAAKGHPGRLQFIFSQVVDRAEKYGDLFADVLEQRQKLPY